MPHLLCHSCPGISQHILALPLPHPPPPSIRLYCLLGMPGMSTDSPILSIHTHDRQSTMQVHAWTCTDGFQQWSEFHWQAWHDAHRHGQIGLNPTSSLAHALSAFPVTVSRWCLEAKFQSDISPHQLTDWSLLWVGWHWGIVLPVWNIHAAPVLMKRHILLWSSHLFYWESVEVGSPRGRNRSSQWMLGMCVRIWESGILKRVNAHTHTENVYFCTHIHALLGGNDGWCVWNSPTLCRLLPPLHHLRWE